MTWSVGFRAYPAQDIVLQFLTYLQDNLSVDGVYTDPDLKPTRHPGKIPGEMVAQFKAMLKAIRWRDEDVVSFIGSYLSEPKASVVFDPPARPPSYKRFVMQAMQRGLVLDARSSLLYRKNIFYMNGEHVEVAPEHRKLLRQLADCRRIVPDFSTDESLLLLLHEWLQAGFLNLD
jgi:50S ribosomal protein L16 3-hydroxylase